MIFTIFYLLSTHLQKSIKPKTHHNWFFIILSKQVNSKIRVDLKASSPNYIDYFIKIFPIIISISWSSFMTKLFSIHDELYVKIFVLTLQRSKLMNGSKYKKYIRKRTWLAYEIKNSEILHQKLNFLKLYHCSVQVTFNLNSKHHTRRLRLTRTYLQFYFP